MNEASILALLYGDTMTVFRHTKIESIGRVKQQKLQEVFKKKCALSNTNKPTITDSGPHTITTENVIYTYPDADIQPGDIIEVNRRGRQSKYIAGKPFYYVSHTVIPVKESDRI